MPVARDPSDSKLILTKLPELSVRENRYSPGLFRQPSTESDSWMTGSPAIGRFCQGWIPAPSLRKASIATSVARTLVQQAIRVKTSNLVGGRFVFIPSDSQMRT